LEEQNAERASKAYEVFLRTFFAPAAGQFPRFDLILLGMGEDGHTASLFPGHPLLDERQRWVASITDSPKPPPERITLTLPVINNARHIIFMATGAEKAQVLGKVLGTNSHRKGLPVQCVSPTYGTLQWYLDKAAAEKIGATDHELS
jgi:6-phosphogluconolactonase